MLRQLDGRTVAVLGDSHALNLWCALTCWFSSAPGVLVERRDQPASLTSELPLRERASTWLGLRVRVRVRIRVRVRVGVRGRVRGRVSGSVACPRRPPVCHAGLEPQTSTGPRQVLLCYSRARASPWTVGRLANFSYGMTHIEEGVVRSRVAWMLPACYRSTGTLTLTL